MEEKTNGMPEMQLNILGEFDIRVGGKTRAGAIKQSSKQKSILCYLILHRDRAVSQAELTDVFYEDENQSNPAGALKMQILRIRNIFDTVLELPVKPIISRRGSYQWNPELKCTVDMEEFERFCDEAERPGLSDEERIPLYRAAVETYKGDPVLDKDSLLWSKALSSRIHGRYIAAVEKFAQLLEACGEFEEMESVCKKTLEADVTNEALHIMLIRALLRQKKHAEARKHYKNTVDILYQELAVRPSDELRALYAKCTEEEMPQEEDLGMVMETMRNSEENREAFFCGFEQFKYIYQLEVRRAMRNGGCLHVAMLTVMGANGKAMSAKTNGVVMDQVRRIVVSNLRQSDVVSRYSNCQYIIMLPFANLEDSHMVMNRILKAYAAQNPRSAIRFSYQIREMELM
ncbi:MAG: hypothetical protein IJV74_02725 [Clostridia bacterium]|nr:hypothetical protein [Clostridia bacterium]